MLCIKFNPNDYDDMTYLRITSKDERVAASVVLNEYGRRWASGRPFTGLGESVLDDQKEWYLRFNAGQYTLLRPTFHGATILNASDFDWGRSTECEFCADGVDEFIDSFL